jgi:hypothetical protein
MTRGVERQFESGSNTPHHHYIVVEVRTARDLARIRRAIHATAREHLISMADIALGPARQHYPGDPSRQARRDYQTVAFLMDRVIHHAKARSKLRLLEEFTSTWASVTRKRLP